MTSKTPVDPVALREEVKKKYSEVAVDPHGEYHFHTGRPLAERLGYDMDVVDRLPDAAVESFAGVGNPFSLHPLKAREKVVDAGAGAGFDSFIAASQVGAGGRVVGIDMTDSMLQKSRATGAAMNFDYVEFREGLLEEMPVEDEWADVVISNGVINLCADKPRIMQEIHRILRPGGRLQFADIANGKPVPESAVANVDLWTAWIAGGLPCADWQKLIESSGFVDVRIGPPMDTFGEAGGEDKARMFEVYGYAFLAFKPG